MAKSYPDIGTFISGQILTADKMNEVADNLDNQRSPSMCRCSRSGDLTYTSGTDIAWNSEDYDTDAMHDNVTNNTRITFNTAGVYLVQLQIVVAFTGTSTGCDVQIRDASNRIALVNYTFNRTGDFLGSAHAIKAFAAGDYVVSRVSVSGATSPIIKAESACWFGATWLGQTS